MGIDAVVMILVVPGTAALLTYLRRRGARGTRFASAGWVGFYGVTLVTMMAARCVDITSRLVKGVDYTDKPMPWDFRAYGLYLLGGVLIALGAMLVAGALRHGRGAPDAASGIFRASLLALAVLVPLIPIHGFFALPLSALDGTVLLVALLARPSRPPATVPV